MSIITDFIDFHRSQMGLTREEYTSYFLSENNTTKRFEQFILNEEDKSRSDGYIPAILKREFEGIELGTEVSADALDYSSAAKDDLVNCYVDDTLVRVPKSYIELQDGEGV
jgi:hypothetical protein